MRKQTQFVKIENKQRKHHQNGFLCYVAYVLEIFSKLILVRKQELKMKTSSKRDLSDSKFQPKIQDK